MILSVGIAEPTEERPHLQRDPSERVRNSGVDGQNVHQRTGGRENSTEHSDTSKKSEEERTTVLGSFFEFLEKVKNFFIPEKKDNHQTDKPSEEREKPVCTSCGAMFSTSQPQSDVNHEEEIKLFRITNALRLLQKKLKLPPKDLKRDVLLGLKEGGGHPAEIPQPLLDDINDDVEEEREKAKDFYAWVKREVFAGQHVPESCKHLRGVRCYKFQFNDSSKDQQTVVSAQLWLPASTQTASFISVKEVNNHSSNTSTDRNHVVHQDASPHRHWVRLNVTEAVRRWVQNKRTSINLSFNCIDCFRKADHHTESDQKHLKPFLIFEYIRGGDRRIAMMSYKHGDYRIQYSNSILNSDHSFHLILNPCCVPNKLKAVDICMFRNNYTPCVQTTINDVQVEKCGCY
ncbi:inhibin beta A chain [Elysia marginata]|uniref:Inhibin beta A chain n=1 Tax=Elysia marginata TaxID=1093978 RepID=A0AAV4FVI7_9GAST|nr:inhibin beta A chain [Elysia marginata]